MMTAVISCCFFQSFLGFGMSAAS